MALLESDPDESLLLPISSIVTVGGPTSACQMPDIIPEPADLFLEVVALQVAAAAKPDASAFQPYHNHETEMDPLLCLRSDNSIQLYPVLSEKWHLTLAAAAAAAASNPIAEGERKPEHSMKEVSFPAPLVQEPRGALVAEIAVLSQHAEVLKALSNTNAVTEDAVAVNYDEPAPMKNTEAKATHTVSAWAPNALTQATAAARDHQLESQLPDLLEADPSLTVTACVTQAVLEGNSCDIQQQDRHNSACTPGPKEVSEEVPFCQVTLSSPNVAALIHSCTDICSLFTGETTASSWPGRMLSVQESCSCCCLVCQHHC